LHVYLEYKKKFTERRCKACRYGYVQWYTNMLNYMETKLTIVDKCIRGLSEKFPTSTWRWQHSSTKV